MFNFNQNQNNENSFINTNTGAIAVPKTFISHVFSWMCLALGITAIVAYYFATDASLMKYLINVDMVTGKSGLSTLGTIAVFAPIAFVFIIYAGISKFPFPLLLCLFVIYSIIMGISLSFIFLAYTTASITKTFFITSGMFGLMAIAGYTTNIDLTKFGSIMYMLFIGIFITSIVNFFLGSDSVDFIISLLGVLVFTGLTAYKVQELKRIGSQVEQGSDSARRLSLYGALFLYITFINLFLSLLRFFGRRN